MPARIEEATREGYPAIRLTDGDLSATFVPQLGMIGASLEHEGEELLGQRNGLDAYATRGSTMGIPLLYPWANRLERFSYEAAGKQVTIDPESPLIKKDEHGIPIHGLLTASRNWHAAPTGESTLKAALDYGAHPQLLEAFPFPHSVEMEVALTNDRLTITTTVTADQESPVPVSFGFHPYLTLPNVPRPEWQIELPVTTHLKLDDHSIPTGETEKATDTKGPLNHRTFDDGYADLTGDPPTFVLTGGGRRIELAFVSGYDYAQVFAPPQQDLICFEPMTAPTNALASRDHSGLQILEPGEQAQAAFSIGVTKT